LISIGQLVIASTANNPEKKYEARIILISRDINTDGSVEVHCHFKKMDRSLIPGMYTNAVIETHSENAITVPEDAIVMYDKKEYVFLERNNNQFQMIHIVTGPSMTAVFRSLWKMALLFFRIILY
jgi:membrane fusion protein, heavy metal efflux system